MMNQPEIKIGDTITFRAMNGKIIARKVTGFWLASPTVRHRGYNDYVVMHNEIISHTPAPLPIFFKFEARD